MRQPPSPPKRSTKCEPMNPAPPVISMLLNGINQSRECDSKWEDSTICFFTAKGIILSEVLVKLLEPKQHLKASFPELYSMKKTIINKSLALILPLMFSLSLAGVGVAQKGFDRIERDRMKDMLKIVKSEVRDKYYDPNFHGIDLDARFKQAEEKLAVANSTTQALAVIAQTLIDFNDSHLFFVPPPTNLAVEYGWRMQAIGD